MPNALVTVIVTFSLAGILFYAALSLNDPQLQVVCALSGIGVGIVGAATIAQNVLPRPTKKARRQTARRRKTK